jgi:hypothetical protein
MSAAKKTKTRTKTAARIRRAQAMKKSFVVAIQTDDDQSSHEGFMVEMTEEEAEELEGALSQHYEEGALYWYAVYEPQKGTFTGLMKKWGVEEPAE